jgi:hypothetical protein
MKKSLLCLLVLATLAMTSISLAATPTSVAASSTTPTAALSPPSLGQPVAQNVWIENKTRQPDLNTTSTNVNNFVWSSLPQFFVFETNTYKVITRGNDSWNDNDSLYTYWVRLISDPDGSLNSTTPRLSGDEVRVWTWFVFENGTYTWRLNSRTNYWYKFDYNNGKWDQMTNSSVGTLTTSITLAYNLAHNISTKRYLQNMLGLSQNITQQQPLTTKYAYFSYWVDMAFLPRIERNPLGYTYDAFVSKDRLVAFVAYNDTNGNGIMDFGVTAKGPSVRSLTSTEADYVFKAISASAVTFIPVQQESHSGYSEAVGWGFSLSNLLGTMAPVGPSTPFNTTINLVQFNFHFMRNSTAALVKVDEILGQFGNQTNPSIIPPQLNGLSLAIVYYSFFEGLSINKYQTTPTNPVGNTVDSEGNTTATSAVNFNSGGKNLVTIVIGGNTYTLNGSQQLNANSETIPWYAFQSSFTAVGNQSIVQVSFSREKSLYAVCFPTWSGYSITHDPYFAVFTYNTTTESGLPTVLIVAGVGIGAVLAVATIFIIRRRKTM